MAQTKEQKKAANRLSSAKRRQREKDSVSKLDTQTKYWQRLLDLHHEAIRKAGLPIPPRNGSTDACQPTSGIEPVPQTQCNVVQHANADANGNGTGNSLAPLSTAFACLSEPNVFRHSDGAMLPNTVGPSWESWEQSQENACQSQAQWQSQSQSQPDSQNALSGEDLFQDFLQDDFGESNMEDSAQHLATSLSSQPDFPAVNALNGVWPPFEDLDIERLLQGLDGNS